MELNINAYYPIEELITLVKHKKDRKMNDQGEEVYVKENQYDVYTFKNESLNENSVFYIAETLDFDEDDNEIFPEEVVLKKLDYYFSCQVFQDIIDLAYRQKSAATLDDFIQCLYHYDKHDDFLDLN